MRKRSWIKRDEPAQSTLKADIHQKKVMLSERNYEADWKMGKGHRTKWSIQNWLMFVICIIKLALKSMKKNEMILLPTQYLWGRFDECLASLPDGATIAKEIYYRVVHCRRRLLSKFQPNRTRCFVWPRVEAVMSADFRKMEKE